MTKFPKQNDGLPAYGSADDSARPAISKHSEQPQEETLIEVYIPRELAILMVGRDAPLTGEMRPNPRVTTWVDQEDVASVEDFLATCLEREMERVRRNKHPWVHGYRGKATKKQALALKEMCSWFALVSMLEVGKQLYEEGGRSCHQRVRRLCRQAWHVNDQVSKALGLEFGDGRTYRQSTTEIVGSLRRLSEKIESQQMRAVEYTSGGPPLFFDRTDQEAAAILAELLAKVDECLNRLKSTLEEWGDCRTFSRLPPALPAGYELCAAPKAYGEP
jgi:hypothetical protein